MDVFQFGKQGVELTLLQQPDAFEHGDMGHRAQHVIFGEVEIHLAVTAYGKPFYLLVDFKVLLPEFHFLWFV